MKEIKNQIYINDLNEKENENVVNLLDKYLKINEEIERLETAKVELLKQLQETNYQTIAIDKFNMRFTITPSKVVDKIDYDKTMEGVEDINQYKKIVETKRWNDDKIKNELNVIYVKEETKPRITITELEK